MDANAWAAHRNGVVPDTVTPPTGELGTMAGVDLVNVAGCDQVRPWSSKSMAWTRQKYVPSG